MLPIIKKCAYANITHYNRTPLFIVIHYTAGTSSATGTAAGVANYFAKPSTQASADFIVDDGSIVQYNPDPLQYYTWAVGGSNNPSKRTSQSGKLYGVAKNANSISIEICSSKVNKSSLKVEDTDWYFTDAALKNAVELTKYLMTTYNIPISNVIMHHHVTGKLCPAMWTQSEAKLAGWVNFYNQLKTNTPIIAPTPQKPAEAPAPSKFPYIVQVTANLLNVRKEPTTASPIVTQVRKDLKFTIVDEKNNFGKLKSGAGWIALQYTKRV